MSASKTTPLHPPATNVQTEDQYIPQFHKANSEARASRPRIPESMAIASPRNLIRGVKLHFEFVITRDLREK